MNGIVKMRDVRFDKDLFINFRTRTILDNLLCSYQGLPKGVNYMIIGDPGVGKTTIILDMLANIRKAHPSARILFISAEMNEIDLAIYVERFPKLGDLDILFIEGGFDECGHSWQTVADTLDDGRDIVAIDSFHELQGIVKEEENVTNKRAESNQSAVGATEFCRPYRTCVMFCRCLAGVPFHYTPALCSCVLTGLLVSDWNNIN